MDVTELIKDQRYYAKHFNRNEYPDFFKAYGKHAAAYFDELENRVDDTPSSDNTPETIARDIASLLDFCEESWSGFRWKYQREEAMDDDKIVLLLFLAPFAVSLGTPSSKAFADALASCWNKRFPDSPFKVGNYEDIVEGFKWKISFKL